MNIICFSHLRWNFVYQRPQHLLKRLKPFFGVYFIEEPIFGAGKSVWERSLTTEGIWVMTPYLPPHLTEEEINQQLIFLVEQLISDQGIKDYILWYYTPMALPIGDLFDPKLTIYDCMDELSAFRNAPQVLKEREAALFSKADIVFTGGQRLFDAKKHLHPFIHCFPSSIDRIHFEKGRNGVAEPADQAGIPHPRIGFFGVIDERMDIDLLDKLAQARPEWQFVLIGPVVKIDPGTLPVHSNIHYLGGKQYDDLPFYLSGWDVAIMPFALNESTRFISPTKTPEYLAGGKPVISTPIHDVVYPYREMGLVQIAATAEEFIEQTEQVLNMDNKEEWLEKVDIFLDKNSWDITVDKMMQLISLKLKTTQENKFIKRENEYV